MKTLNNYAPSIILVLLACTVFPSFAFAKVNIFACEPEWGALSKEIGGDLVHISTATNAHQDVHHIRAKPSLLAAMRRADMAFCSGASLEIGWLPVLIKKAGGSAAHPGSDGWLMAADYVKKLDVPKRVDRAMGDVHPDGNPHVHLDPHNIQVVANVLADKLSRIDPAHASAYQKNLARFTKKWSTAMMQWQQDSVNLHNTNIVVGHNSWVYLAHWLGLDIVASLEPKPGIPPTASHLESVLNNIKGKNIKAIVIAPYENKDAARWLAKKTGIPVVNLPFTVGGNDQTTDLFKLFDISLKLLKGS